MAWRQKIFNSGSFFNLFEIRKHRNKIYVKDGYPPFKI